MVYAISFSSRREKVESNKEQKVQLLLKAAPPNHAEFFPQLFQHLPKIIFKKNLLHTIFSLYYPIVWHQAQQSAAAANCPNPIPIVNHGFYDQCANRQASCFCYTVFDLVIFFLTSKSFVYVILCKI